ncbi:MAG: glycoside hydrolase family 19 protein [Candidatus Methylomirabilota bacterium]
MITLDQLRAIIPFAMSRAPIYLVPMNDAMAEFQINTPARQAAFLAQVAHESGSLRYTRELASGAAYEGREDLGNTEVGDGAKYRGRGLIQITGRANMAKCSAALYGDPDHLLSNPEVLELPAAACRSAAWFWQSHGLNELADAGDFIRITKRVNGGTNGYADRLDFYERAKKVLL